MTTWDPTRYGQFSDERARPFFDLMARVAAQEPRLVVEPTDVTDDHGLFEGQGLTDRADAAAAGQPGGAAAGGASADTSTAGA